MSSLDVLLSDLRVGTLERLDDAIDTHRFTPDPKWLTMPGRPVLGQIFEDWLPNPKDVDGGLFPWFDHLLPLVHRPQRRAVARDAGVEPEDGFALLAWLGDDLIGAVRLRVNTHAPLRHRREVAPIREATDTATYRSSLPGAQWKLSLAEDQRGITLPVKGQAGEWIAKFHADGNPAAVRIEHATMRWAHASGLNVPEIRKISADEIAGLPDDVPRGDGDVYLIRRFDRSNQGRVHAEDFAQILDLPQGPRQFSANYEDIARVLAAIAPVEDLRAFVRQLVFCILIGNDDAHAKNWSVIYPDGRRARLSPAYDLVPTFLMSSQRPELALRLNGARSFADVTVGSFASMARLVGVTEARMSSWVIEDAARVRDAWASPDVQTPFAVRERARLEGQLRSVPIR